MRKIVLLGVLSLAVAVATPSLAAVDDVNGPSCLDIVSQAPSGPTPFGSYSTTGTVRVGVALGGPACKQFDYTVTIVTAEGEQTLALVDANSAGDFLIFEGAVNPETNSSVCVYATTSAGGGRHVFDRAPDTGCVAVAKSTSPGFSGFN